MSQNLDAERLTGDISEEEGDAITGRGDEKTVLVETLEGMKQLLLQMEQDQRKIKEETDSVSQDNRVLAERVHKAECHGTELRLNLIDFETRLVLLEDKVESMATDIKRLPAQSYENIEERLQTSMDDVRKEYRSHFADNFSKLLTALERLDRRVQLTEADLQSKLSDLTNKCFVDQPRAKSTGKRINVGLDSQSRIIDSSKVGLDEQSRAQSTGKKANYDMFGQRKRKPIQAPPKFNGKSSWEAFQAQFNIAADINEWEDDDKAAFLATALEGKAALVLSNMSDHEQRDYRTLVAALTSRFGVTHQSELARAKLKSKVKGKEESMSELVESVESLTRTAYPDATPELQDVLARDNFIDALQEDDLRLRIRQARPQSLQAALETALELESFQLASRHRNRWLRGSSWNVRKVDEENPNAQLPSNEGNTKFERLEAMINQLLQEIKKRPQRRFYERRQSPADSSGNSPPPSPKCWTCNKPGHLARGCPDRATKESVERKREREGTAKESEGTRREQKTGEQGNGKWSA